MPVLPLTMPPQKRTIGAVWWSNDLQTARIGQPVVGKRRDGKLAKVGVSPFLSSCLTAESFAWNVHLGGALLNGTHVSHWAESWCG